MRVSVLTVGLAATFFGASLASASAMPVSRLGSVGSSQIHTVRLVCNSSRCIDPETGAYTYSGCNSRGCYPTSGVIGNERSGRSYGRRDEYEGPRYGRRYYDDRGPGYGPNRRFEEDDDY